jgi:hypothetical protein
MTLDIQRLYNQGRAKSPSVLWSPEENEFLHVLVNARGLNRTSAADYLRNGIMSLEDYDKAVKAKFEPKKLDDAHKEAEASLKEKGKKAVTRKKK